MNKTFLSAVFITLVLGGISGQSSGLKNRETVLFLYEESNENIDPWLSLFRIRLEEEKIPYKESSAAHMNSMDLALFDNIFLYGAVMAFTFKEPLRDWLESEPALAGKEISLFVTANRWFLDKYTGQLQKLVQTRKTEAEKLQKQLQLHLHR